MENDSNYYVYVYVDPTKPGSHSYKYRDCCTLNLPEEPFYVGKGKGKRFYNHFVPSIRLKTKSMFYSKLNSLIEKGVGKSSVDFVFIVAKSLTESRALEIEEELIKEIGTKHSIEGVKQGPLTNMVIRGCKSESCKTKIGVKLQEKDVIEIYELSKACNNATIAEKYKISRRMVSDIKNGRLWKNVYRKHFPEKSLRIREGAKMSVREQVEALKEILSAKHSQYFLAEKYHINQSQISRIASGERWKRAWEAYRASKE